MDRLADVGQPNPYRICVIASPSLRVIASSSLRVIASAAKQSHALRVDSAEESHGAQDRIRETIAPYYTILARLLRHYVPRNDIKKGARNDR